ncbi:MAG: DUF2235 domain-containing protein [Gammaproteobacteria bacterium]|nr:DUF2235 domain-containing protein [Gammaproteobacteria bacterium]
MAKNLIFCFDGTENDPNDVKPEKKWFGLFGEKDNSVSNVFKLHLFFGGDLENQTTLDKQHSFYYSGVGTYGSWLRQKLNAALAPEKMDVRNILNQAGADLAAHYKKGDKIYVFGFSRGAALARRFACLVNKYVPAIGEKSKVVRFLGVFDTVASIGVPNLEDDQKPRTQVVFENMTVSAHVQEAIHLVSIDENRIAFQPTLMNMEDRVTEVWFPGAHSDVGGGFAKRGLSDSALRFIVDEMQKREIGLTILSPEDVELNKLVVDKGRYTFRLEDIDIQPNHLDKLHVKKRFWPFSKLTLDHRNVRVNVNDQMSSDTPVVFCKMVERAQEDGEYRPMSMHHVGHHLLYEDGRTETFDGLAIHLLP